MLRPFSTTFVMGMLFGLALLTTRDRSGKLHAAELSDESFDEVRALIQPQAGESLWRHVPWQTDLNAARCRAAAEGKPLLLWAGGGSAPLGGC